MSIISGVLVGLVFAWIGSFLTIRVIDTFADFGTEVRNGFGSCLMFVDFLVCGVIGGIAGYNAWTVGSTLQAMLLGSILTPVVAAALIAILLWVDGWTAERHDLFSNSPAYLFRYLKKILNIGAGA